MTGNFLKKMMASRFLATVALALAFGAQNVSAATTALTFDDLISGTDVASQYQSLGVTAAGATVLQAASTPWPANSTPNIAYAPSGLMSFAFDATTLGSVQSVSAYISGENIVGLYAYDSNGNLVGQSATLTAAPTNALVSVTSSGNPIATLLIHDGGSSFTIDNLTITSAPAIVTCTDLIQQLSDAIAAAPDADFRRTSRAPKAKLHLSREVDEFRQMVNGEVRNSRLRRELRELSEEVIESLKAGSDRSKILEIIKLISEMVKNNNC